MPADRVSILYNPSAGMGRALDRKIKLERLLRHFDVRYDLVMTRSEEHLRELTREHARTYPDVVGAGGDSTFHIMINELVAAGAETTFGMLGVGSSNDIPREFGLASLDAACRALKAGGTRRIDLGGDPRRRTPLGYFLGQANIGLGAYVNRFVADLAGRRPRLARRQTLAGLLGIRKAYASGAIPCSPWIRTPAQPRKALSSRRSSATSDSGPRAGSSTPAPGPTTAAGRLPHRRLPIPAARPHRRPGPHRPPRRRPDVEFLRAPSFEVTAGTPFAVQVDGEILRTADGRPIFERITFSVVPGALNLICP